MKNFEFIITAARILNMGFSIIWFAIWDFLLHATIDVGSIQRQFRKHFQSPAEVGGFSHSDTRKEQDE